MSCNAKVDGTFVRHICSLTGDQITTLINAAPDELENGHLHHILVKLGRDKHTDRVLALQRELWYVHDIDPIMGADIYVWAPMAGVHTDEAIEYVVSTLEKFFKQKRNRASVLRKLRSLGAEAQEGFPDLAK